MWMAYRPDEWHGGAATLAASRAQCRAAWVQQPLFTEALQQTGDREKDDLSRASKWPAGPNRLARRRTGGPTPVGQDPGPQLGRLIGVDRDPAR